MHSVTDSAQSPRERRRVETTQRLISLARQATASDGLNGFTVDELCDRAEISRRTFFNYFASKEDAVLGIALHLDTAAAEERFVTSRPETVPGELSPTLLADLAILSEERWAMLEIDRAAAEELMAAAEREPRLIAHMLERHRADELKDIALVARRENLDPADPRIIAATLIVGHLARVAVAASLDPESPRTFGDALEQQLAAAHAFFATQTSLTSAQLTSAQNDNESSR